MLKKHNMTCKFSKYKKEIKTHYIGNAGNEYPIEEYGNWGRGVEERGNKDLPLDGYPYTYRYKIEFTWRICRECNCKDKE